MNESSVALTVFDLLGDSIIRQITYHEILDKIDRTININNCYINHVSFAPDKESFLFFLCEKTNESHFCALMLWRNGIVYCIENLLSASHYAWRDNNTILATCYTTERKCGYYLYDLANQTKEIVLKDSLNIDGHPTFIDRFTFITDTYPDKAGYQKLLLVDMKNGRVNELISLYSTSRHMGEKRCDLHPRFSSDNNLVILDADVRGKRKVYLVNIREKLSELKCDQHE